MIRVLSRDPERSMLGLVACQYCAFCIFPPTRVYALLQRGGKGGDPARVALEGTTEYELLGHDCGGEDGRRRTRVLMDSPEDVRRGDAQQDFKIQARH
jgi:hypothetical protein